MKLDEFLKTFNIQKAEFERSEITWKSLEELVQDYNRLRPRLEPVVRDVADRCRQVARVHSVRHRLKDGWHLAEKVVRKKVDDTRTIVIGNYRKEVTDLIGVRLLHLFKEDWSSIHDAIIGQWNVAETPIAYHREGDSSDYLKVFVDKGCTKKIHPRGYRSVHYLVRTAPAKEEFVVELQVRTLFEEAWSEIDHRVTYPYDLDHELLKPFLGIFNRLAGQADEMGSFVSVLKEATDGARKEREGLEERVSQLTSEMRKLVEASKLDGEKRTELERKLKELEKAQAAARKPFELSFGSALSLPHQGQIREPMAGSFGIGSIRSGVLVDAVRDLGVAGAPGIAGASSGAPPAGEGKGDEAAEKAIKRRG